MAGAYAVAGASEVRIAATNERIRVVAESRPNISVEGGANLIEAEDSLTVEADGGRLTVRIPEGIGVVIGTTSARVDVKGEVGAVAITTESGLISVESARSVDARTLSGRVELGQVDGNCRARSKSGRVTVQRCAAADVATASGAINLDAVSGDARAHCVSGRINIVMSSAQDVFAETVSGRISITMPRGTRVLRLGKATLESVDRESFDSVVDARSSTGRVSVSVR